MAQEDFDYAKAFGLEEDPYSGSDTAVLDIDDGQPEDEEYTDYVDTDIPEDDPEDTGTELEQANNDSARIAALEEQLRQRDIAELSQKNQALEQTLKNLQARLEKEEQEKQAAPSFDWDVLTKDTELTDEEKAAYNPQTLGVIQKLAARIAAEHLRRYDEGRIGALQEQVGRVQDVEQRVQMSQAQIAQQREIDTANAVISANPWVTKAKDTAEYQAFLAGRLPGTVYTRAQLVEAAIKAGNSQQVNEILATYPGANQTPRRQNVAPGGRPNTQVAPPSQEQRSRAGKFQYKTYVEANRRLAEGSISVEDYNKIEAQYSKALASGDIEF